MKFWSTVDDDCVPFFLSLSSSILIISDILNCNEEKGCSLMNWTRAIDGIVIFKGKIASFPYNKWKGEVPIEAFLVILSAHNAKVKGLC